jgi:hypothetical protein
MDYVLILYICSVISGSCMETMPMPRAYKTHTECVINGSKKVTYFLEQLDKKDLETAKLYVAYTCAKEPTT